MSHRAAAFAARQSQEEMRHQFTAMARIETGRRVLALVPFVVASVWLPLWICLTLLAVNFAVEVTGYRLLRRITAGRDRQGYWRAMACFGLAQVSYMMIPALTWQDPDVYAKAFAVGIYLVNLNHLATVRAVHMPLALSNLVPATLVSLAANAWFWWRMADWRGLMITTFCILALTYFVLMTMRAVHGLHLELLRDRQSAQGANDAKSRFLAQMSHELRTPLNAIMGMGYAEMTKATDPESRERLDTMVRSARGLSVLLDDILDLSAVEAGTLPIRPTVVDLRAEIEATAALFRQQVAEAGQWLQIALSPEIPALVRVDGQRVRQCLSNVLSNAVKYGGTGRLSVTADMQGPGLVVVDLADNGPGVPPALQDHIFEPFQRGDGMMPGMGLGLSISRRLARRMGGNLELVPSPSGARFRLSFAVQPVPPGTPAPDRIGALPDLTGKRVLVVDDLPTNRMVAATYLRLMGALPLEAESGASALALLQVQPADAVLLDMLMPGMDGLAVLAELRRLPGQVGATPVIAMTADATEDRRRACLEAGLDGYIAKPLSPEALGQALTEAMALGRIEPG